MWWYNRTNCEAPKRKTKRNKTRRKIVKFLKKLKEKKKRVIFIVVILLIILMIGINKSRKQDETQMVTIETAEIEKRDIAQSISATGKITTSTTKTVTSALTGVEIATVNVKEGQKVSIGDVICTFDMTETQESLAQAQASANLSSTQANLGIESAQRSLNDAINSKGTQIASSQNDVNSAKQAYDTAQNQLNQAREALQAKQTQLATLTPNYQAKQAQFAGIESEYTAKQNALNTAQNAYDAQAGVVQNAKIEYDQYFDETGNPIKPGANPAIATNYANAKATLTKLEMDLNTAKTNLSNYQSTYDTANAQFSPIKAEFETLSAEIAGLQENVTTLETNTNTLKSAYEKSVEGLNSASTAADMNIASMQDALKNAELSVAQNNQTQNSQLKPLQDQLEKGVVTSTVNGTVTTVGVKQGDLYAGGNIATIEGTEEMIIEAEIGEYDIPDVKEGMKVFIKTDATREEELEGRIVYVATTATGAVSDPSALATGAATSSSNATYTIKIELLTPNERLRLGMNAKLSIITQLEEQVWAVPYDCIYEREDGSHYIEIAKNEDGTEKEELNVEKGLQGTYYTKISSPELKKGMKVIMPTVDAGESVEKLLEMIGADAGM